MTSLWHNLSLAIKWKYFSERILRILLLWAARKDKRQKVNDWTQHNKCLWPVFVLFTVSRQMIETTQKIPVQPKYDEVFLLTYLRLLSEYPRLQTRSRTVLCHSLSGRKGNNSPVRKSRTSVSFLNCWKVEYVLCLVWSKNKDYPLIIFCWSLLFSLCNCSAIWQKKPTATQRKTQQKLNLPVLCPKVRR